MVFWVITGHNFAICNGSSLKAMDVDNQVYHYQQLLGRGHVRCLTVAGLRVRTNLFHVWSFCAKPLCQIAKYNTNIYIYICFNIYIYI